MKPITIQPIAISTTWRNPILRFITRRRLTKKAEPPPTRGVNRDSGTNSANGGWLRRLVRPRSHVKIFFNLSSNETLAAAPAARRLSRDESCGQHST